MSINPTPTYYCECCHHVWDRKYNYDRHMFSIKHDKMSKLSKISIEMSKMSIEMSKMSKLSKNNDDNVENNNSITGNKNCGSDKILKPSKDIKTIRKIRNKIIETRYCCDYCKFSTKSKKESEKHRKSKQHVKNENKEEDFLEITNEYSCLKCDKVYNKYVSCYKHTQRCNVTKNENTNSNSPPLNVITSPRINHIDNITMEIVENPTPMIMPFDIDMIKKEIYESIVGKMIENNNNVMSNVVNVMDKVVNVVDKMITNVPTVQNTTTNNNTTNNHCTINLFLNDKCRDAINITDWVNNIVINFDNLYYNAEHGFQKGLTKILVDNLNLLSKYKRPIHFTDLKRDIMYIKDADEWTKHDNNDKLVETLDSTARKGICCFAEWMEANTPAYHNLDSHLGQLYMKIHQSIIQKQVEKDKAFPKVLKEVARTAYLTKDEQV
jgi:hypothetical protein